MTQAFDRLPFALRDALASATTVVTPNNRLARRLSAVFDATQAAQGRAAWPAAVVLSWEAWMRSRWLEAVAASTHALPRLLSSHAASRLWQRVIASDGMPMLDPAGATALAVQAWSIMQAWGTGTGSWRAWRDDASSEDAAAFARWAEAYRAELVRRNAIDGAMLADALVAAVRASPSIATGRVLLAGFIELAPQQQRLLQALADAGTRIDHSATLDDVSGMVVRMHPASPHDELAAALDWAAAQAARAPDVRVAVVVADLDKRRETVRALAHERLAPRSLLPGHEGEVLPFDVSLGTPLAEVPLVACALRLVTLTHGALPIADAAALVRSPYLPGAEGEAWLRRAALERTWLEGGRKRLRFGDVVHGLDAADTALASRWREARAHAPWPTVATPRAWTHHVRDWLARCGWPGARTLDSAEWQARGAFDELLAEFAALASIDERLDRGAAVQALREMAQDTTFQPEGGPAQIAILGTLEAAGLPFDATWVVGLCADRWPSAPSPQPLLPVAWQRERGAPRSSPDRERLYAQALTDLFMRGAPEVVLSCARRDGDAPLVPSSLMRGVAEQDVPPLATSFTQRVAATDGLERARDVDVPALAPGVGARGGAAVLAAFADCPFQAIANWRLRADPWPMPIEGLSHQERGVLLHEALARFWGQTRDQATLLRLSPDDVQACVREAAQAAVSKLPTQRWSEVPAAVKAGEEARLVRTLLQWLEVDRQRPPFRVEAVEARRPLAIGGITLDLRIDRLDVLDDGSLAIVDYKSGDVASKVHWFDAERPRAPQLGLYALAQRAHAPQTPVRAVAYVVLRPDRMVPVGLAADDEAWPTLGLASNVNIDPPFADWPAVEAWWDSHLGALAARYASGHAAVAPRQAGVCANCGRQMLCRIGGLGVEEEDDG